MGTKHLDSESIKRHMTSWNLEFLEGRSAVAPGKTQWGPQPTEESAEEDKVVTAVNSLTESGSFKLWGGCRDRSAPPLHGASGGSVGQQRVVVPATNQRPQAARVSW